MTIFQLNFSDDPLLLDYVLANAEYKDFDYEDVIIDNEEELDGLHVILNGMVKVLNLLFFYSVPKKRQFLL